jgi:hypothetical protein
LQAATLAGITAEGAPQHGEQGQQYRQHQQHQEQPLAAAYEQSVCEVTGHQRCLHDGRLENHRILHIN